MTKFEMKKEAVYVCKQRLKNGTSVTLLRWLHETNYTGLDLPVSVLGWGALYDALCEKYDRVTICNYLEGDDEYRQLVERDLEKAEFDAKNKKEN